MYSLENDSAVISPEGGHIFRRGVLMIVVVMGVAGAGKTTIGRMLADRLGCTFVEGDALHSKENIEKMSRGIPLTDGDRAAWLAVIHARMLEAVRAHEPIVVACSALKESYRKVLAEGVPITWVYLKGSEKAIRSRLEQRNGHYMKATMLASQFGILEEPSNAILVDVSQPPDTIVEHILVELRARDRH
jgi:gluconokinase